MEWLTITPPLLAIVVAIWTRNVFWALGLAIWLSETIIAGFNPFMGALGGIDRAVGVFDSSYNTRVLLFCLIIGALIVYMQRSGGISAMVERLQNSGFASTPRRASLVTAICGLLSARQRMSRSIQGCACGCAIDTSGRSCDSDTRQEVDAILELNNRVIGVSHRWSIGFFG